MDQKYRQVSWISRVMVVGLIVVLASGCSLLKSKGESQSIDPPPLNANLANENVTGASAIANTEATNLDKTNTTDAKTGTAQVTLYFKDANGYVAPISMN